MLKYIVNIYYIKEEAKSNITKKHYKYKKATKNCQRNNSNNTYNIFDRSTILVLDYKILRKEEEEK